MAQEGLLALQSELLRITLPDFTGDLRIPHVGRGRYEFHRWGSPFCCGSEVAGAGCQGKLESEEERASGLGCGGTSLGQTVG